jgi:hypothetical protein
MVAESLMVAIQPLLTISVKINESLSNDTPTTLAPDNFIKVLRLDSSIVIAHLRTAAIDRHRQVDRHYRQADRRHRYRN